MLLTKDFTKISSFPTTYGEIRLYGKYTSQDNINNYTSYELEERYYLRQFIEVTTWDANLDGKQVGGGYRRFEAGETTLVSKSGTLDHNKDGSSTSKTISYSFSAPFGGGGYKEVNIEAPKIERLPEITKASDFNDEGNPTIYFTNPASFKTKPVLKFYNKSNLSKPLLELKRETCTSPYTWNITNIERDNIRKTLKNSKTYVVSEIIQAYNNDKYIGESSVNKEFSFVNAEPSVSLKITETNQKVIDVYKNSNANTIIKNISKLNLTSTEQFKKYATLKSKFFVYNGIDNNANAINGVVPTSNYFEVKIVDSREYATNQILKPKMEDYIPLKINNFNFERLDATSSKIILNADITYYQHTYNGVVNSPKIYYRVGKGANRLLPANAYSIDTSSNKIRVTDYQIIDTLEYTQSERAYFWVSDIFSIDEENEIITKGIPTYEVGEFDFQVNGNLWVANTSGQNEVNILDKINTNANNIKTNADNISKMQITSSGNYTKFPDGTCLIRGKVSNNNVPKGETRINIALPITLVGDYDIALGDYGEQPYWAEVRESITKRNIKSFELYYWNSNNNTAGVTTSYIIMGKWK